MINTLSLSKGEPLNAVMVRSSALLTVIRSP